MPTETKTALVVAEENDALEPITAFLKNHDYNLVEVKDGAEAMNSLQSETFNLVFCDLDSPIVNGLDLARHIQIKQLLSRCIIYSNQDSSSKAMAAVRAGADDYFALPMTASELEERLNNILSLDREDDKLINEHGTGFSEIIGQSPAIKNVFRLINKVALSNSTIMITGASGTGKELIAKAIHMASDRKDNQLIPVNCGAIPEELLESELFGHEKGAFTNAIRTRIGRFELAHNGTIFLDEIADMSPKLQVKLLRVLQSRQFERIGGTKTIEVDIRIIAATNKDIHQAMLDGQFREDLYYRLNVIPIAVPALIDRTTDIPLLVDHFLEKFGQRQQKKVEGLKPETMDLIMNYNWPGNIRELENVIERMIILTEDTMITPDDMPERIRKMSVTASPQVIRIPDEGLDFNKVISEYENEILIQALEKANWVKNKAAKLLNLNRTTLVEKLKKKKITPPSD